jgi:hypothetical protein
MEAGMATMTFDDLPEEEQAAFLDICTEAKLDPADFNVSFTEELPGDPAIVTKGECVIVLRNTITRAYASDSESAWTVAFEEEVKAGVFN